VKGSRDLLLEFWNPSVSREWFKQEISLFDTQIDHDRFLRNKRKIRSKGYVKGNVTYFQNFRTPSISLERFKLETSYLLFRLITRRAYEKNAN